MVKKLDLQDTKIGRLTILERLPTIHRRTRWRCRCDCGNIVTKATDCLTKTKNPSCGCFLAEITRKRFTKHGMTAARKTQPEYYIWRSMKNRCYNEKCNAYKWYGAQSITMDPSWFADFSTFLDYLKSTIGLRPSAEYSIDRIDCYRGYTPGNIRWATKRQQMYNRKKSQIHRYSSVFKGVSWDLKRKKWAASIAINGRRTRLGRFDTEKEAAKAYNNAAEQHYKTFAHLNKIDD